MSHDPSILAPVEHLAAPSAPVKREAAQPNNDITHVGMTMVPETNLDLSMLNLGRDQWSPSNSQDFSFSPQVYAVLALPEEPVFSANVLSGKNDEFISESTKSAAPIIPERFPSSVEAKPVGPSIPQFTAEEREDPSFALYVDVATPAPAKASPATIVEASRMLESSLSGKASIGFQMVLSNNTVASVDELFAPLASTLQRIERSTSSFF